MLLKPNKLNLIFLKFKPCILLNLKLCESRGTKLRIPENGTMNDRPFLNTLTTIPKKNTIARKKRETGLMCFLLFPLSSIETKFYTEEQNDSEQHKLNGHFEMSQQKKISNGLV